MKVLFSFLFIILTSWTILAQSNELLSFFKKSDTLNTKVLLKEKIKNYKSLPTNLVINELFKGDTTRIYIKENLVNFDTQEEKSIYRKCNYKPLRLLKINTSTILVVLSNSIKEIEIFSFQNNKLIDTLCISQRLGDTETFFYKASKIYKDYIIVFDYSLDGNTPGFIEVKKYAILNGKFILKDKKRQKTDIWPSIFISGTKKTKEIDPFYK